MDPKPSRLPPVAVALRVLWRIMESRQRWTFVALCLLLATTAFLEMGGMVVLFGFVRGLEVDAATGHRKGPIAGLVQLVLGGHSTQLAFVLLGGLVVFGFMVFKNAMGTAVRFAISRFLMKINHRISVQLYRACMLAPYESFLEHGFRRRAEQVGRLFDLFTSTFNATVQLLSDSAMVLMVLALLLYLDFRLAILSALLFAGVGVGLYSMLRAALSKLGTQLAEAEKYTQRFLNEGLQGLVEVRLRGTRDYFVQSYSKALGNSALLERRKDAMAKLPRSGNELALASLIVGATLYVTLKGQTIADALPTLGVFGFAGLRMSGVLSRLSASAQTLRLRLSQFEESYETLRAAAPTVLGLTGDSSTNYLAEEKRLPKGVDGRLRERISFEAVSYKYPGTDRTVLTDVTLDIHKGEFVAFCGPSGGGKTTLLLLLMGMLRPTSGVVASDGRSIFSQIQAWHRNIGYVSQSLYLVGRSIRDNVAFGIDPAHVDDEKVWNALRLASAESFVRDLPGQLDASLVDTGGNISGGQRQRLIIARALYEDPEVILLDEATAALDNATEREVTSAIEHLGKTKTIVAVAHRLTTIQRASRIYFLMNGRVQASGTYAELLANEPEFARMALAGGFDGHGDGASTGG